MGSARISAGISRMVVQNQFSALAERINVAVAGLQWQCGEDRRRLQQLERKVDTKIEDRSRDGGDSRDKWADIQGSVNGLIEETQGLTRRVEGLDERLWARTSGAELSKQRSRELEQQVQALEHQSRLAGSAIEETQKRHSTKLRRTEHALEDAVRRVAKTEDQLRISTQRDLEVRVGSTEQHLEQLLADVRDQQLQIDEGFANIPEHVAQEPINNGLDASMDDALRASERGLATLDRRLTGQVEDMASIVASLRVKVDGQLQRVGTLAERVESAHVPALESLRAEMAQLRQQDRREIDGEVTGLRDRMQETAETCDEVREGFRQARAEIAALSLRPDESRSHRIIDERCGAIDERFNAQEQELLDLRERMDFLSSGQEELQEVSSPHHAQASISPEVEEALRMTERSVATSDKRLTGQFEDMTSAVASLRVKVDGQLQRVGSLAERLETAHEPAIESLRAEMAQIRSQDKKQVDTEMAALRKRLQESAENSEDTPSPVETHEALRQVRTQIEAIATRLADTSDLQAFEERCGATEQELQNVLDRMDALQMPPPTSWAPTLQNPSANSGMLAETGAADLDEALAASERALASLDKRLSEQVEEVTSSVASLRVKVDGQLNRVTTMAERIEVAHEPALESLRVEFTQLRTQDRRDLSGEISSLRDKMQTLDTTDDSMLARSGKQAVSEEALNELEQNVKRLQDAPHGPTLELLRAEITGVQEKMTNLTKGLSKPEKEPEKEKIFVPDAKLAGQVEEVTSSLASIRKKVDSEAKRVDADLAALRDLVQDSKIKAQRFANQEQVEELSTKLEQVRKLAEASNGNEDGIETLRNQVEDIARDLRGHASQSQVDEMRTKLELVEESVLTVKAGAQVSKGGAAADTNQEELKVLRGQLDEFSGTLKGLAHHDQVQALTLKLEEVSKGAAQPGAGVASEDVDGLRDQVEEMLEKLEGFAGQEDVDVLGSKVKEVSEELRSMREASTEASTEAKRQLTELLSLKDQLAKSGSGQKAEETQPAALDERLAERLAVLERRLPSSSSPRGESSPLAGDDEEARTKVQTRMTELTQQMSEELESLSTHQDGLSTTQASLVALSAKVSGLTAGDSSKSADGNALDELTAKLDQRMTELEDANRKVRKELTTLTGPSSPRKVGIGMSGESQQASFSLADAKSKLDALAEQVSDLQSRPAGQPSRAGRSALPTPDASLNFSLTEADKGATLGGDDLNFSLTEQSKKGGGSLNFSLTEQSIANASLSESVPMLQQPPPRRGAPPATSGQRTGFAQGARAPSSQGSLGSVGIEEGQMEANGSGSESDLNEPVPAKGEPLKGVLGAKKGLGGAGDVDDILDSLARGEVVGPEDKQGGHSGSSAASGDALDSLVGVGRKRPQASKLTTDSDDKGLARVDEETSDLGDLSSSSRQNRSGGSGPSKSSKSRSGIGGKPDSPQSGSSGVEASLDASLTGLTGNEVSIGADYSVDDSLELDKCDFVEEVKPMGPLKKLAARAATSGVDAAGKGAPDSPTKPGHSASGSGQGAPDSPTKPGHSASGSGQAGGSGAAATIGVGVAGRAKAGGSGAAATIGVGVAGRAKGAAEENDYGDESFDEGDMSVPESIEESVESGSGSDRGDN